MAARVCTFLFTNFERQQIHLPRRPQAISTGLASQTPDLERQMGIWWLRFAVTPRREPGLDSAGPRVSESSSAFCSNAADEPSDIAQPHQNMKSTSSRAPQAAFTLLCLEDIDLFMRQ
jgi:hypothetical protein